jgi:hypothetical protein
MIGPLRHPNPIMMGNRFGTGLERGSGTRAWHALGGRGQPPGDLAQQCRRGLCPRAFMSGIFPAPARVPSRAERTAHGKTTKRRGPPRSGASWPEHLSVRQRLQHRPRARRSAQRGQEEPPSCPAGRGRPRPSSWWRPGWPSQSVTEELLDHLLVLRLHGVKGAGDL